MLGLLLFSIEILDKVHRLAILSAAIKKHLVEREDHD